MQVMTLLREEMVLIQSMVEKGTTILREEMVLMKSMVEKVTTIFSLV